MSELQQWAWHAHAEQEHGTSHLNMRRSFLTCEGGQRTLPREGWEPGSSQRSEHSLPGLSMGLQSSVAAHTALVHSWGWMLKDWMLTLHLQLIYRCCMLIIQSPKWVLKWVPDLNSCILTLLSILKEDNKIVLSNSIPLLSSHIKHMQEKQCTP